MFSTGLWAQSIPAPNSAAPNTLPSKTFRLVMSLAPYVILALARKRPGQDHYVSGYNRFFQSLQQLDVPKLHPPGKPHLPGGLQDFRYEMVVGHFMACTAARRRRA